jgi:hypothetical protein
MPSRKLSPWRYRPFTVLQQISPVVYCVQLPKSWQIHNVFHVDLLIPYHETEAYGTTYSQPPPKLIDGDEEYEVEEIITYCTYKCKKQYLVKWVGCYASVLFLCHMFIFSYVCLIFSYHVYYQPTFLLLPDLLQT